MTNNDAPIDAKRVTIGWDGASKPMVRLQAPCGCRWFLNGRTIDRTCPAHLAAALNAEAARLAEPAR